MGKLEMNSKKDLYDHPASASSTSSVGSPHGRHQPVAPLPFQLPLLQASPQWCFDSMKDQQSAKQSANHSRPRVIEIQKGDTSQLWKVPRSFCWRVFGETVWSVLIGFHPIQTSLGFALLVLILKLDLWSGRSLPFVAQIFSWTNSKSWPGKLLFHQENKWLKSLSCLISGFKCSVIISLNWSNAVYKLKITEAGTLTTSRSYRSNTQKLLWETHCKKRDVRRWSFSWKYKATPPSLAHGNALLCAFFKEYPRTGLKFRLEQHFSPAFCFPAGAGSGAIWRKLETDHWSNS